MKKVAIIGAGLAGLAAAKKLRRGGMDVTIFEKSRGFGGRMATRRTGEYQFDHGAQYFSVRGPEFFAQVTRWQDQGHVAEWAPGTYVGSPGMTAPLRALAAKHRCITECLVTGLHKSASGWTLEDDRGPIAVDGNGTFDAAILAIPAPQAIPLAASAGIDMPELREVVYAPCIALMLAYPNETARPKQDWIKPEDSAIAWIACNATKPGRPRDAQTFVVHARPDWSRRHLDSELQASQDALLARFSAITGIMSEPLYASVHRWRYALVEQDVGLPCLFDKTNLFGACGDWCLGARVESASESGCAMGDTMLAALQ